MTELYIINDEDQSDIPAAAWARVVESDPDFVADPDTPRYAFWAAWPEHDPSQPVGNTLRFDYVDGAIYCKHTDASVTRKACEVAARLDAFVVGDDLERYKLDGSITVMDDDGNRVPHKKWRWDDPEFWRPPTPEEVNLPIAEFTPEELTRYFQLPGWQRACKRAWFALKRRFAPKG